MFQKKHILLTVLTILVSVALHAKVIHVEYYPNGEKKIEFIREKIGLILINQYYEDGGLHESGYLKRGQRHGKWISYNPSGVPVAEAYFYNDTRLGSWTFYDQWKETYNKVTHRDGRPYSYQTYNNSGDLIASGLIHKP